ncbi:MAG: ISL3 family transposase, partial [Sandaracinaceae bacterium]
AVARGQLRKRRVDLRHLGVDEKATRKGQRYMTLVCDLEHGTVEYVGKGRRKTSLDGFFAGLDDEQRAGIEAVAMDMWDPYVASVRESLPDGQSKIVFDRFHIMKNMNDAVDEVRRTEHRTLTEFGLDTLKSTKHLWLYGEENLPEKHAERFEGLRSGNLKTARAWAIKEQLRGLWDSESPLDAKFYWKRWDDWASRCRLAPVETVAKMIRGRYLTC